MDFADFVTNDGPFCQQRVILLGWTHYVISTQAHSWLRFLFAFLSSLINIKHFMTDKNLLPKLSAPVRTRNPLRYLAFLLLYIWASQMLNWAQWMTMTVEGLTCVWQVVRSHEVEKQQPASVDGRLCSQVCSWSDMSTFYQVAVPTGWKYPLHFSLLNYPEHLRFHQNFSDLALHSEEWEHLTLWSCLMQSIQPQTSSSPWTAWFAFADLWFSLLWSLALYFKTEVSRFSITASVGDSVSEMFATSSMQ